MWPNHRGSMAVLIEIETQQRHVVGARAVIGRSPTCEVRLSDPRIALSHTEVIRLLDGTFQVHDLGSAGGTFIGADKIEESPLHHGDELRIGPVRLRFETAEADALVAPRTTTPEFVRLRAVVDLGRTIGLDHALGSRLERALDADAMDRDLRPIHRERVAQIGHLASGIASDVRDLLAAIQGYVETIEDSLREPRAPEPDAIACDGAADVRRAHASGGVDERR